MRGYSLHESGGTFSEGKDLLNGSRGLISTFHIDFSDVSNYDAGD